MATKRKREVFALAWAWQLEDGSLCRWAEPYRNELLEGNRPSNGAKPVCVRMTVNRIAKKRREK